jgi:hypothetical protein
MEPFKFMHEGKEYTSYGDPAEEMTRRLAAWGQPAIPQQVGTNPAIAPDDGKPAVLPSTVVDTQEDTAMTEMQTEVDAQAKKAPAKKSKAKGAGPTAFSTSCKEHKIDAMKARRALRAEGLRAPHNPKSKQVQDVLKAL